MKAETMDVSKAARGLAHEIRSMCFVDEDMGRGDEHRYWATLDENQTAQLIQAAMDKAWAAGVVMGKKHAESRCAELREALEAAAKRFEAIGYHATAQQCREALADKPAKGEAE